MKLKGCWKQYPTYEVEVSYLNTIEQLFFFVEQLDKSEVCLPFADFYLEYQY